MIEVLCSLHTKLLGDSQAPLFAGHLPCRNNLGRCSSPWSAARLLTWTVFYARSGPSLKNLMSSAWYCFATSFCESTKFTFSHASRLEELSPWCEYSSATKS